MSQKLSVEIWSDIACPWCYVGKRRFEAALSRFAQRASVEVRWRAFELDPSAPARRDDGQSYAERLAQKYGTSVAQGQQMIDRMVQTAAVEGIDMDFVNIRPGNTFAAHRVLHLAHERGVQDAVKERMLRGYLCEGAPIGDLDTIVRLAADAGLDVDEVTAVVQGDRFADVVRADQREARELGVDGVPFFLLGRRYAIGGAQPADLMLRALQQTWDELPRRFETLAEEPAGPVCGPEGCT